MKINRDILDSESNAPLYHKYATQLQPQPAFLYLTADGEVGLDWASEIGGVPADVWHDRTFRWYVSPFLSKDACDMLLNDEEVLALLERVHSGHYVEWDGSNHVGRLTEDARDAKEALEELLDRRYNYEMDTQVWNADDWITAGGVNCLTDVWREDEPLDEAVERLEKEAKDEGIVLYGSVKDALIGMLEGEDPEELSGEHLKAYNEYIK